MMTAKERQRIDRLESENAMLREQIAKHMRVYGDCLIEIIELRVKLDLIESALRGEA